MIFRTGQVRRVHLPDKTLLGRMAMMLAASCGYLIAWTAANDEYSEIKQTSSGMKFVMCSNNFWHYSSYGCEFIHVFHICVIQMFFFLIDSVLIKNNFFMQKLFLKA
jgi:hypothetical protein